MSDDPVVKQFCADVDAFIGKTLVNATHSAMRDTPAARLVFADRIVELREELPDYDPADLSIPAPPTKKKYPKKKPAQGTMGPAPRVQPMYKDCKRVLGKVKAT